VFQVSCWLFGREYALFRSSENRAPPRQKRATRKPPVSAAEPKRAPKPFVLHAVGEDPALGERSKDAS
jgi:hypothetical protein